MINIYIYRHTLNIQPPTKKGHGDRDPDCSLGGTVIFHTWKPFFPYLILFRLT